MLKACIECSLLFEPKQSNGRICKICMPLRMKRYWKEYAKKHSLRKVALVKEKRLDPKYRKKESAWARNWQLANQKKFLEIQVLARNRRRLRLLNRGNFTAQEWKDKKEEFKYTCPSCLIVEPDIRLTIDHIIPISKGGSNTIDNIQPLCKPCNSSKNAKTIIFAIPELASAYSPRGDRTVRLSDPPVRTNLYLA